MRKAPLFTALCAIALVLSACASANRTGDPAAGSGSTSGTSFRNSASRPLTADAKLALGTIKLEGTAQAIDAKTAAKLIPLWQLMVQLHSSSSAAPQEVTAVLEEIQATMTPSQVNAIDGMSFTSADVFSLLQSEAQANSGSGGAGGSGSNGFSGRNNRQGGGVFFAGPGGFGGGPGGGGFGGGFGGGGFRTANGNGSSSTSQLTPAEQAQAAQARENAISSLVENQLIRLLETKLGRQPG